MKAFATSAPMLLALASAAILAVVYVAQYQFGLEPCPLCLWQRWPYFIVLGLVPVAALLWPRNRARPALLALFGVVLLGGGGIAFYHVGVEAHWWAGTESCGGGGAQPETVEDLRAALLAAPVARCDSPALVVLGLSMAAWNMIVAAALAAFSFASAWRAAAKS